MNDVNSLTHTRWNCKYHIEYLRQSTEERYSMEKSGEK